MKILIIRLSAIGDTIHCLPVAAAIKRRFAGAEVGWLVEAASAPLLVNNPAVDRVHVLPRKEWAKSIARPWKWPGTVTDIGAFWSGIRKEKYEIALEMQGLLKSAMCAVASGAPVRAGFAGTREGAERLLTDVYDAGDYFAIDRHVVDLNLSIVEHLAHSIAGGQAAEPAPVVFPLPAVPAEAQEKIDTLLTPPAEPTPDKGMVSNVVLIPGTTWPSKVWPAENWARLAAQLATNLNCRICLTGGAAESTVNGEIAARAAQLAPAISLVNLTGKTSLVELLPLFQRCELVIGADTGPLHLAAAQGQPKVLGIYGSSPWLRNGPYGNQCASIQQNLWCQPCYSKVCPLGTIACLNDLKPEDVYEAAMRLIQRKAASEAQA